MNGDLLDVTDDGVGLLVLVLQAEAAYKVNCKEKLNEIVSKSFGIGYICIPEGGVVGIDKGVVACCDQHHVIEHRFALVISANHESIEKVFIFAGDRKFLTTLFLEASELVEVLVDLTFFKHDVVVQFQF